MKVPDNNLFDWWEYDFLCQPSLYVKSLARLAGWVVLCLQYAVVLYSLQIAWPVHGEQKLNYKNWTAKIEQQKFSYLNILIPYSVTINFELVLLPIPSKTTSGQQTINDIVVLIKGLAVRANIFLCNSDIALLTNILHNNCVYMRLPPILTSITFIVIVHKCIEEYLIHLIILKKLCNMQQAWMILICIE
jgi:hypothetical protein